MFDQAQVISLTPAKTGSGGTKTAVPSSLEIPDIRDAKNVVIKQGAWQNLGGVTSLYTGGPTSNGIIYPYIYHSSAIPVVESYSILAYGTKSGTTKVTDMTNGNAQVGLNIVAGGFPMSFETVKELCYFSDGATPPQVYDGPGGRNTYYWGIQDGPTVTGITVDLGYVVTGTVFSVTNGNATITRNSGTALNSLYGNKSIFLPSTIATGITDQTGVYYKIVAVDTGGGTITLDRPYTGTTFAGPTYATSQINYGNISWDSPPTFACSYYDSSKAHSGNIGNKFVPAVQVAHHINYTIDFTGDTTGALARADQIIIWSTTAFNASGSGSGATLYTLGHVGNANGGIHYADPRSTGTDGDNVLGTDIGPFPAPYLTNDPPLYFRCIAYWNGTMWGLGPQGPSTDESDLSLLKFSRIDDPGQIGRGEECWPILNFLRIPARDGSGLGLAVIGDTLIVTTERYLYYVAGTGPGDYRLAKLSSRGLGVSNRAICEFIGDAQTNSSAMIFLGRDRVVWAQAPGGPAQNLSISVQDIIDAYLRGNTSATNYPNVSVSFISIGGDTYAFVLLG